MFQISDEQIQEAFGGRFWPKVRRPDEDGCWLWMGHIGERGYGHFRIGRKMRLAHRVAYEVSNGEIADGNVVRHTCDNPRCVNPNHLVSATQSENINDMYAKGRGVPRPGEAHHNAKLTEAQVLEIRRRYAAGGIFHRELAAEFGVKRGTIGDIISGSRWGHLPCS